MYSVPALFAKKMTYLYCLLVIFLKSKWRHNKTFVRCTHYQLDFNFANEPKYENHKKMTRILSFVNLEGAGPHVIHPQMIR